MNTLTARQALDLGVWQRSSVGLAELNEGAALQRRVDRKYLLTPQEFEAFVLRLPSQFRVMQINDQRVFRYESAYFDTRDLLAYRAHKQGARRRYKVRTRKYVDTGLEMFEVKTKSNRGETVKHRCENLQPNARLLRPEAHQFLDDVLQREYGTSAPSLAKVMDNSYSRATFADVEGGERLTADVQLTFCRGEKQVLGPERILLETKTSNGRGTVDGVLSEMGIRSVSMSKYCIGIAMLYPDVSANKWNRLLRNTFEWERAT